MPSCTSKIQDTIFIGTLYRQCELKYHRGYWNRFIYQRLPEKTPEQSRITSRNTISDSNNVLHSESVSSLGDTSIKHDLVPDTSASHTAQVLDSDNCLDVDINVQEMVITESMTGVELALRDHQVLTVRNVLEVF